MMCGYGTLRRPGMIGAIAIMPALECLAVPHAHADEMGTTFVQVQAATPCQQLAVTARRLTVAAGLAHLLWR